jgi:site-specific recombinase XerC
MGREESSDALDRYSRELKRIIAEVAKIEVTELARLCREKGQSVSRATIYAYRKGYRPPADKTSRSLHRVIADVQNEYDPEEIVNHLDALAHEARLAQEGGQADQERPVETLPVHVGEEAAEAYNEYVRDQLETSERFIFVANSGYR